jgi:hypothetical protein
LQSRPGAGRSADALGPAGLLRLLRFLAVVSGSTAAESTAGWRLLGEVFHVVVVPTVHAAGGFFILDFLLSGQYTWGRTLRTFVLFLGNLILAYEFVYRDLQTRHPEWPGRRLFKSVMGYSVIPFVVGLAALLILSAAMRLAK